MLRTHVYVDGFNLYYGCLKGTQYKWLNIEKLCELYFKPYQHSIEKIFYFTAKVSGTPNDLTKPQRQETYVRALYTLPGLEIIDGHFITEKVRLQKADGTGSVLVVRQKEKRSDVNLTTRLLCDAFDNKFDCAVLISGDSDFRSPMLYVRTRFRKITAILDPQKDGTPNSPMNREASIYKPIRRGALGLAQFPIEMADKNGKFYKPQEWFL